MGFSSNAIGSIVLVIEIGLLIWVSQREKCFGNGQFKVLKLILIIFATEHNSVFLLISSIMMATVL